MKILLHDYCGHPFQYQLARELAGRGHVVEHLYCGSNPTTPQGIDGTAAVNGSFRSRPLPLPKPIAKGAFVQRWALERRYGTELARAIDVSRPDLTVFANTPIDALGLAMRAARRTAAPALLWVQDLLGEAALRILPSKIGAFGHIVGRIYRSRESRLLNRADYLVAISEDFAPAFQRAGVPASRWTVIPNWGPLSKIEPIDKVNAWSVEHGLDQKKVLLYSGSLGFKHNPTLLLSLAKAVRGRDDIGVVVNSEGAAADWLRAAARENGLEEVLHVNGFQSFERMSEVLASADILLAVLEPDAGVFSVPSKVFSNLCAGRPQVLAVPAENLAAKIVVEAEAGLVCEPRNEKAFVTAVLTLVDDPQRRMTMGRNARDYAAQNFQIEGIAEKFEAAFARAMEGKEEGLR